MNPTLNQIQEYPKEDRDRYYEYVQRSLKRMREETRNKTETEIDFERNQNAKCK